MLMACVGGKNDRHPMLRKRLRSSAGGRYSRRRRGEALVLYSKRRAEQRQRIPPRPVAGAHPADRRVRRLFPPLRVRAVRRSVAVHRCRPSDPAAYNRDVNVNVPMKRKSAGRATRPVLDWIEMRVIHVSCEVAIISDRVLLVPSLPNAAFRRGSS